MRLFAFSALLLCSLFAFKAEAAVYELRTYTATPGKMAHLEARFRDHTVRLFKKHGMGMVGFWVPTDKPETLVYVLSYPDRAAATAAWKSFLADPEWVQARADSERNGGGPLTTKVESVFMSPTDYSPIK